MHDYKPGYAGQDSMRKRAEEAFAGEMRAASRNSRSNTSAVGRETNGNYKKGGHTKVHRLSKEQTDLHIPRKMKGKEALKGGGEAYETMKKGGKSQKHHKQKYGFGGFLSPITGMIGRGIGGLFGKGDEGEKIGQSIGGIGGELLPMAFLEKGGRVKAKKGAHEMRSKKEHKAKKHHYARGGNVVSHETIYEREMVGERPSHKMPDFNYESQMRGVKPIKRAAGGVAKIRHKEATKKGMPIKSRKHHRYMEGGEIPMGPASQNERMPMKKIRGPFSLRGPMDGVRMT